MKIVRHMDGKLIMRPNQPYNQDYWSELKQQRRKLQRGKDGKVYCGTCWTVECEKTPFDLHHRHYDNFTEEKLEDVVLLCRSCHEAITSRIRFARYAAGDRSMEMQEFIGAEKVLEEKYRPPVKTVTKVTVELNDVDTIVRFQPENRYI